MPRKKAADPKLKKKPPKDDRPQAERFIETARMLRADESGKTFDQAFGLIIPAKTKSNQPA